LYDACPHAPVARAHAHGQGQASYKSKQSQTFRLFFMRADHADRAPFSVRIRTPRDNML
jgi:hypothetical protein